MNIPEDTILAVKRGAAFLDEHYPEWQDWIDLSELRLSSCDQCVLGQLFGEFSNGVDFASSVCPEVAKSRAEWAVEHGFVTSNATVPPRGVDIFHWYQTRWTELDAAWLNLLHERGLE